MSIYAQQYETLELTEDAVVTGMVTHQLVIKSGDVVVSGMVTGDLIVEGGTVRVTGSVDRLIARSGAIDVTGRVGSLRSEGGETLIAVGAMVNDRVLGEGGRWVSPAGSWSINNETPRFNAAEVL